jgi:hypothetical protein
MAGDLLRPPEGFGLLIRVNIDSLKIVKRLIHKIPPNLPLLKGGIIPLFGKEGGGEIFWVISIPRLNLYEYLNPGRR